MTRTILAAVGLIGLAACGGGSHHPTKAKAAAPPKTASRAISHKQKTVARRDTTTQRNPLTNH